MVERSKESLPVIARYVRRARGAMRLSQEQFGELVNRTKANVSAWENGRHEPSWEVLQRIERMSQLPIPGSAPHTPSLTVQEFGQHYGRQGSALVNPRELLQQGIPWIRWDQLARTDPAKLGALFPEEVLGWLSVPFQHSPKSFALRVVGESMFDPSEEHAYRDGDFIVVDPERESRNRSSVIVQLPESRSVLFRQLFMDTDGRRWLCAKNKDWPNRISLFPEDATIKGVVIGRWTEE